ncbi:hypothetical protein KDA23_06540 [Candidatus Saccharibacteria bacterium]|nr:hypothetical protein [Candidatus Saccharibacteria bacterium]
MTEQSTGPEVLKENPVIVVDIDGVLFDTPQHAVERWNSIHGTDYKVEDIFDIMPSTIRRSSAIGTRAAWKPTKKLAESLMTAFMVRKSMLPITC